MKPNRILLLALALTSANSFAAERNLSLLPAANGDQVPGVLVAASAKSVATLERAPAQFSWAIPSDENLVAQQPQVRESREYWARASAAELEHGFALHTTAPGALVRLSPVEGAAKTALNLDQIEIRKGGAAYGKRTAMAQAADAAQLEAAGASFPEARSRSSCARRSAPASSASPWRRPRAATSCTCSSRRATACSSSAPIATRRWRKVSSRSRRATGAPLASTRSRAC
jgi:hypothetical protein